MDKNKYIIVKGNETPFSKVIADCTDIGIPISKGEALPSILKKIVSKINNEVEPKTDYKHVQSIASSTWTINHNLGYKPGGIMVFDSAGEQWVGDVTHIDNNTLVISFNSSSFGGIAYIS